MLHIFTTPSYNGETFCQLCNCTFYLEVNKVPTTHYLKLVKATINSFISDGNLPQTASNLIQTTPRTSHINFLPKIHKANNPGRPANFSNNENHYKLALQ